MSNKQLELGFEATRPTTLPQERQRRAPRAAWWFAQMRQIVSQAIDWESAPEPRPEQPWLGLSHPRHSA